MKRRLNRIHQRFEVRRHRQARQLIVVNGARQIPVLNTLGFGSLDQLKFASLMTPSSAAAPQATSGVSCRTSI